MIDTEFIIKYTNALYSTPVENQPRYDEFRDMFSSGQLKSKEWIISELHAIDPYHTNKKFIIVGAWFGTLGIMIKSQFPGASITMLDVDPRCEKFIHNIIYDDNSLNVITEDMYRYNYEGEDYVINTSCEHIPDITSWLSLLPKSCNVVLQSNNFIKGAGHINCINNEKEFIQQCNLSTVIYAGSLEMPMYTRYMIIGRT